MTNEQAIEKAKEQYSEIWDCDINHPKYEDTVEEIVTGVIRLIMQPTSEDCVSREFIRVKVEYPPEDLCTYPEYKGKPYFSIVYRENGEEIVGYGTYKPEVLTDYLKRYFMPTFSDDCVSRKQAKIDIIPNSLYTSEQVIALLDNLSSVIPTHGTCKNCEHWKDSDGVYRRGVDAESKCPINIKEVYEGDFYCKDFKKRGSEE